MIGLPVSNVDFIFSEPLVSGYGSRLGINFVQASQPTLALRVGDMTVDVHQALDDSKCDEAVGIPSVVWDCALLLTDVLVYLHGSNGASVGLPSAIPMDTVLDLGCGTGVGGMVCGLLGAREVCFSDKCISDVTLANMAIMERVASPPDATWSSSSPPSSSWSSSSSSSPTLCRTSTCTYDWLSGEATPFALCGRHWDLVVCSDVIYDANVHDALLQLVASLSFSRLILTYKRRHDAAERKFLNALVSQHSVAVATGADVGARWSKCEDDDDDDDDDDDNDNDDDECDDVQGAPARSHAPNLARPHDLYVFFVSPLPKR